MPKKRPVIIYIPNDEGEGAERHEKIIHDIPPTSKLRSLSRERAVDMHTHRHRVTHDGV